MKAQANKKRTELEFAEGDLVYLKLQPYVQSSVATRSNQKLGIQVLWTLLDHSEDSEGGIQA
jgi:hypothetical protein